VCNEHQIDATRTGHRIVTAVRDDRAMLIRTWSFHPVTIVDLHGRLDVESGTALHEAVCRIAGEGARCVVLNLAGVTGMDAAGLGTLADVFGVIKTSGGELRLVVRSAAIRELLARTRLLGLLPTLASEADAIASFELSRHDRLADVFASDPCTAC
jgi:anti-anti-sigma factor